MVDISNMKIIFQIAMIDWFKKLSNIQNCAIWKINEFSKFKTLKNEKNIKSYNPENLKIINFTIWKNY